MTTTLNFQHGLPDFDWEDLLRQVLQEGTYLEGDGDGYTQVSLNIGGSDGITLFLNSDDDIELDDGEMVAGTITSLSLSDGDEGVLTAVFSHTVTFEVLQALIGEVPTQQDMLAGLAAWFGSETVNATGSDGGEVMYGGSDADILDGGEGRNTLTGGEGNDQLIGGSDWDDVRYGRETGSEGVIVNLSSAAIEVDIGDGTIEVLAGQAKDTFGDIDTLDDINFVSGTAHADYFQSQTGVDDVVHYFMGGDGADTIVGGEGHDGTAYDLVEIESGGDGVIVNLSASTSHGIASMTARDTFGNIDVLVGSIEGVNGSVHDDTLVGGDGYNRLDGYEGNDLLLAGGGNDELYGQDGADTLIGNGGNDYFVGGDGDDSLNGGTGENDYEGGSGADIFTGATNSNNNWDKLYYDSEEGGSGIVVTYSGKGDVSIRDTYGDTDTGTGIDEVKGSRYKDTFNGSSKANYAEGMGGADTFNMGGGQDRVSYQNEHHDDLTRGVIVNLSSDEITASIGFGNKTVAAGRAIDTFGKTDKLISVEAIDGTQMRDHIVGGGEFNNFRGKGGNDGLFGNGGEDFFQGDDGKDTIDGGKGDDHMDGGAGKDKLTGGSGEDDFNFGLMGKANADTITDFKSGEDELWLWDDTFGLGSGKLLKNNQFLAGDGLHDAATSKQHVIYDTDSGNLYFDRDGKGGDHGILVAILKGGVELHASDIQLG